MFLVFSKYAKIAFTSYLVYFCIVRFLLIIPNTKIKLLHLFYFQSLSDAMFMLAGTYCIFILYD